MKSKTPEARHYYIASGFAGYLSWFLFLAAFFYGWGVLIASFLSFLVSVLAAWWGRNEDLKVGGLG